MATIVSHGLYRFDLNTIRLSTISGIHTRSKFQFSTIRCSASNEPSSSSEISSTAKIRSEVLTPFRSLRMFFYLAFIASGGLGGLIAISRLIGALANSSRAAEVPEILKGLGIDFGAVFIFAFLYYRENNAKNAQIARLSREENLSNLKLRVSEKKIIPLSSFRGIARFVICAGPASYISEAFRRSESFTDALVERGVLVVPLVTDGELPEIDFNETEETKEITAKRKRLWQLATHVPVLTDGWSWFVEVVLVTLLGMLCSSAATSEGYVVRSA
ncbi:unnamed protein product [Rhodiola kirilowii]